MLPYDIAQNSAVDCEQISVNAEIVLVMTMITVMLTTATAVSTAFCE